MESLVTAEVASLRGKRVFVTGHTGFKGSWLTLVLHRLGAKVTGYSLAPPTTPSLYDVAGICDLLNVDIEADIRDTDRLSFALRECQADVVVHLAAQPLVRLSFRDPLETFSTNVGGTASVLEAIRRTSRPCAVIVVTSDKCYEPNRDGRPHRENDPMGGHDPYSASKGAAELITASFRHSYFPLDRLSEHGVQVATVRAGNVIGGGDWAEDRIVTDIVASMVSGRPVRLRNPDAIRPWQHVLEPVYGYVRLAATMLQQPAAEWCTAWNFGPSDQQDISVRELTEAFVAEWGGGRWESIYDPQASLETPVLRLDVERATTALSWTPRFSGHEAIHRTAAWYRHFMDDPRSARRLCLADIDVYESISN